MPKIGKDSYFIRLISKKTKIKPQDIFDVLMAFSECAAEAFFEANPAEKERVNFGAFTAYWKMTNFGPGFFFNASTLFEKHTALIRYEQNSLLATQLYQKMLPINRERVAKRAESIKQNIAEKKPKKQVRPVDYAIKAKENRIKLKEKRKKQAILLKAMD